MNDKSLDNRKEVYKTGKTIEEVTRLLAGNYHSASFAVYCLLATGIDQSEYGEFHFNRSELIERLTYKSGNRPIKFSSNSMRVIIERFWEDGLFDFRTHNKGSIARYPSGNALWNSII